MNFDKDSRELELSCPLPINVAHRLLVAAIVLGAFMEQISFWIMVAVFVGGMANMLSARVCGTCVQAVELAYE